MMDFAWDEIKAESNERKREPTDDLEPEYVFRSLGVVVRGKYAERYRERL